MEVIDRMPQHNIFLISLNDIFREGLAHILQVEQFNVVRSCRTISDLEKLDGDPVSMILIDCPKPKDQKECVEQCLLRYPSAAVVVLSEVFDLEAMIECFHSGVRGYLKSSTQSAPLITALRLVSLGEYVFPSDLAEAIDSHTLRSPSPAQVEQELENAHLSPREFDVLCCLMAGYANKVIARELDVCEATVKVHVKAILRKLRVQNRTQAAIWASSRHIGDHAFLS